MKKTQLKAKLRGSSCDNLVCLVGKNPSTYSQSRVMWNSLFIFYNIDAEYIPIDTEEDEIEETLEVLLKNNKVIGLNITNPFKRVIANMPLIELNGDAIILRAVNTISKSNGINRGYSTDGYGALKALEERTNIENNDILVLGAGGSGSAIALACAEKNNVFLANRTYSKANRIAENSKIHGKNEITPVELYSSTFFNYLDRADIVINTLPIEKSKKGIILEESYLKDGDKICMDIVYGHDSIFLRTAEQNGNLVIDGRRMLLHQAFNSMQLIILNGDYNRIRYPTELDIYDGETDVMDHALMNLNYDATNEEIKEEMMKLKLKYCQVI